MWNPFRTLYRLFKGAFVQQIYLITIDATNLPRTINYQDRDGMRNARSATLSPGIQNFYFIMAPDADTAKSMVVNTFRAKPLVAEDVSRCITATPLSQITKLLDQKNNTWSYIPIGGIRAAGQQGNNDTLRTLQQMQKNANSENPISHMNWQPPKPVTYDAQVVNEKDLRNVAMDEKDRRIATTPKSNAIDPTQPMTPEQMMATMQQMMETMNKMQSEQKVDLTKHSPAQEPDLAARIRANMTAGPVPENPNLTPEEQAEIDRLDAIAGHQVPVDPHTQYEDDNDLTSVSKDDNVPSPPEGWVDDDLLNIDAET